MPELPGNHQHSWEFYTHMHVLPAHLDVYACWECSSPPEVESWRRTVVKEERPCQGDCPAMLWKLRLRAHPVTHREQRPGQLTLW